MRSAIFTGISAIWNFCNFWNSKQKFEIPALLQGGTICLVSPVKNSEFSNKNCRRSSVFKKSGISAISAILSRNLKFRPLLQGGTICLVSPVKNSELSNKNCRRSSDLKQKLTDDDGRRRTTDDGQISNTISSAELTFGSAELIKDHNCLAMKISP